MTISMTIHVIPKAQMRARSCFIQPKGRKGFISHYKHSKQQDHEGIFKQIAYQYAPDELITGAISLDFIAYLPRPKSHYGTGRNADVLKSTAPKYHIVKPDKDNLEKFIKDCMTGIFYKDDCQIVSSTARKVYSESPRWEISLTELT